MREGSPWFVAKDVCDALGMNSDKTGTGHFLAHLEQDECATLNLNTIVIPEGNRKGNPNVRIINESGLYSLILKSLSQPPQAATW